MNYTKGCLLIAGIYILLFIIGGILSLLNKIVIALIIIGLLIILIKLIAKKG